MPFNDSTCFISRVQRKKSAEAVLGFADFMKILAERWYVVIALPVLVGLAIYLAEAGMPVRYEASTSLTVSTDLSEAYAVASDIAAEKTAGSTQVLARAIARSKTIVFYAQGEDADSCVIVANEALSRLLSTLGERPPGASDAIGYCDSASVMDEEGNHLATAVLLALLVFAFAMLAALLASHGKTRLARAKHVKMPSTPLQAEALSRDGVHNGRGFRLIVYYIISILLVLSTNSLYYLADNQYAFTVAIVFLSIALVADTWRHVKTEYGFMLGWAMWAVLILAVLSLICCGNNRFPDLAVYWAMGFAAIAPLMIHLVKISGELQRLFTAFCNIVAALAAISVVLWIAGPIAHVLETNCVFVRNWGLSDEPPLANGWCFLLFQTGYAKIGDFAFWRNTGVFPEGPMYAYVLVVALCIECFMGKRPRLLVLTPIALAILSSFSTTAILLAFAVVAVKSWAKFPSRLRPLALLSTLLLVAVGAYFLFDKLQASSGMTHVDDFRVCLLAWLDAPVLGHGFNDYGSLEGYMGDFRLYNYGLSNSIGAVLAFGGLAYLSLFLVGYAGYLRSGDKDMLAAGVILFVLWAVTIIYELPLSQFVLAIGAERLCGMLREPGLSRLGVPFNLENGRSGMAKARTNS